jgi:uncharacterized protein (TIGR03083 family)
MIAEASTSRLADIPVIGHDEWIDIGRVQQEKFLSLLNALSESEWNSPTDCELWTVKDIVAHLLGQAQGFTSFAEQGRQMWGGALRRKELGTFLNAVNQTQVDARRDREPQEVVAGLREVWPRFLSLRHRLGRFGKGVPFYDPNLGPTTLRYLMDTIFARDAFMHRVDVSRATGREIDLGKPEARLVADVARDWARRHGVDAAIELHGPAGSALIGATGAAATIRGDAVEFCRVLAGRAAPDVMTVEGDEAQARGWLRAGCPF